MNKELKKYIDRYVHLNSEELELFSRHLELKNYKKKSFLLREGTLCRYKFFITEGLVRTYYIDVNGNEKVTQFGKENWWVTDMESFINETFSKVYIEALENTSALVISKDRLEELYKSVPKVERLFRLITEKWLIAQQRSSHFYMKASSKDRYYFLVESIPNFVQRVPQYMIASYLDITPEYLSELRKAPR